MATIKVVIELRDDLDTEYSAHETRNTLMDALAEFQSHRGPTAAEYVAVRYPDTPNYGWLDRADKINQVARRKSLAEDLRCNIRVFEEV